MFVSSVSLASVGKVGDCERCVVVAKWEGMLPLISEICCHRNTMVGCASFKVSNGNSDWSQLLPIE